MIFFISIDDTDNLEQGSTGHTANGLRKLLEEKGWGHTDAVTRHQLLVHPDIPYTSHNSAMCFKAELDPEVWEHLIMAAGQFLEHNSASGSDPGLCIVREDWLSDPAQLSAFGYRAKIEIISKEEAYLTARRLRVHLSEHGGSGDGIIGALAGAGLRMSGNDGRFQGRLKLKAAGEIMRVEEIKQLSDIELVETLDGYVLSEAEPVVMGEVIKTVLRDHKRKLLVYRNQSDCWQSCSKQQLRQF
ncbi:MAG: hypothetical protein GX119_07565 [Syntrophomonadaceae bacterium]|jgi:hypothetical protein|nr:hypothetical protein [Syntrophomonadaceae bacterium]